MLENELKNEKIYPLADQIEEYFLSDNPKIKEIIKKYLDDVPFHRYMIKNVIENQDLKELENIYNNLYNLKQELNQYQIYKPKFKENTKIIEKDNIKLKIEFKNNSFFIKNISSQPVIIKRFREIEIFYPNLNLSIPNLNDFEIKSSLDPKFESLKNLFYSNNLLNKEIIDNNMMSNTLDKKTKILKKIEKNKTKFKELGIESSILIKYIEKLKKDSLILDDINKDIDEILNIENIDILMLSNLEKSNNLYALYFKNFKKDLERKIKETINKTVNKEILKNIINELLSGSWVNVSYYNNIKKDLIEILDNKISQTNKIYQKYQKIILENDKPKENNEKLKKEFKDLNIKQNDTINKKIIKLNGIENNKEETLNDKNETSNKLKINKTDKELNDNIKNEKIIEEEDIIEEVSMLVF